MRPKALRDIPRPWYENGVKDASRDGKFGEILTEDEFLGMMQVVDVFDLVFLEGAFQAEVLKKLKAHPILGAMPELSRMEKNSMEEAKIKELVDSHKAEGMYFEDKLVGCVKQAHDIDVALSHHVMFENLVGKASSVIALQLLLHKTDLNGEDVDYIIECSEEACGDMNQRGGGNFAKSIGELCGCVNATGSDTRSFCAGPAHAFVEASALVGAGVYENVVIVAGGCTAKMGMNSKNHVEKGMPVLEDCLGAFAIHIGKNDGVSPIILSLIHILRRFAVAAIQIITNNPLVWEAYPNHSVVIDGDVKSVYTAADVYKRQIIFFVTIKEIFSKNQGFMVCP